jgi:hypothetical protein
MNELNSYLYSLINPFDVPTDVVTIPDLKFNTRLPKSVTYNSTFSATDLDPADPPVSLMLVFKPMSQKTGGSGGQIQIWGKRLLDTKYYYFSAVAPDQNLADNFKFIRYVSGGVGVQSDTVSAGTFAVQGSVNGVWTKDPPNYEDVNPSTLPSYRQSSEDVIVSARLSDGIVIIGGPSPDTDWYQPESNVIFDNGKSSYNANFYYNGYPTPTFPTTRPSSAGWVFDGTTTVAFDSNRLGAEIIYGMTGLTSIDLAIAGVANFITTVGVAIVQCTIVVTYSDNGVDVDNSTQLPATSWGALTGATALPAMAAGRVNYDTPSPITRIRIIFGWYDSGTGMLSPIYLSGTAALNPRLNATLVIKNDNVATVGQETGVGIATIDGIDASAQLSLVGRINYEAIPDKNLVRNVKTTWTGGGLKLADLDIGRTVLGHKGLAGIRGVYRWSEYTQKSTEGFFMDLATRHGNVALASDWGRGLRSTFRWLGKHARRVGKPMYEAARPLIRQAIRESMSAGTGALLGYAADTSGTPPPPTTRKMVAYAADREIKSETFEDSDDDDITTTEGEDKLLKAIDPLVFKSNDPRNRQFKRLVSRVNVRSQRLFDTVKFGVTLPDGCTVHNAETRLMTAAAILVSEGKKLTCNATATLLHHLHHVRPDLIADPRVSLPRVDGMDDSSHCGYRQRCFCLPASSYDNCRTLSEFQRGLRPRDEQASLRPNLRPVSKARRYQRLGKGRGRQKTELKVQVPEPTTIEVTDETEPPTHDIPSKDIPSKKLVAKAADIEGKVPRLDMPPRTKERPSEEAAQAFKVLKTARPTESQHAYVDTDTSFRSMFRPKFYNKVLSEMMKSRDNYTVREQALSKLVFRVAAFPVKVPGVGGMVLAIAVSKKPFYNRYEYFPVDVQGMKFPAGHNANVRVSYADVGEHKIDTIINSEARQAIAAALTTMNLKAEHVTVLSDLFSVIEDTSMVMAACAAAYGFPMVALFSGSLDLQTTQYLRTPAFREIGSLAEKIGVREQFGDFLGYNHYLPPLMVGGYDYPESELDFVQATRLYIAGPTILMPPDTICTGVTLGDVATMSITMVPFLVVRSSVPAEVPIAKGSWITTVSSTEIRQVGMPDAQQRAADRKLVETADISPVMRRNFLNSINSARKYNSANVHRAIEQYVTAGGYEGRGGPQHEEKFTTGLNLNVPHTIKIQTADGFNEVNIPPVAQVAQMAQQVLEAEGPTSNMGGLAKRIITMAEKTAQGTEYTDRALKVLAQMVQYYDANLRGGGGATSKKKKKKKGRRQPVQIVMRGTTRSVAAPTATPTRSVPTEPTPTEAYRAPPEPVLTIGGGPEVVI